MRIRNRSAVLISFTLCVLAAGCIDAFREGLTSGIRTGISSSVEAVFLALVGVLVGGS